MTRKLKSAPYRSQEGATVESFRKDPAFAAEYLNSILEDGDQEELMPALRRMSEAFGGVQKLAGKAQLNANTLYRTLSPKGNPELKTFRNIFRPHAFRARLSAQHSLHLLAQALPLSGKSHELFPRPI